MSERPRPAPRRRRRGLARLLALGAGAALAFALGVAFGQALRDEPTRGTRTEVRTLRPGTIARPGRTVTVTVTVEG